MPPRHDINVAIPTLPSDITGEELDRSVRAELSTLPALNRDEVARHLVAAGRLIDDDPETAFAHAVAARRRASRIASVREAVGLTAYALGRYDDALPELRAARRMTGSVDLLPVIADVERALGHPERALAMAVSDEAKRLDAAGLIEMRIVASGARRDLGQLDAAVLTLQVPEARKSPRLAFAYADALAAAGRNTEARDAFVRAAALDLGGDTDAARRLAEIDGVRFVDTEGGNDADEADTADDIDDVDDIDGAEDAVMPAAERGPSGEDSGDAPSSGARITTDAGAAASSPPTDTSEAVSNKPDVAASGPVRPAVSGLFQAAEFDLVDNFDEEGGLDGVDSVDSAHITATAPDEGWRQDTLG